MKLRFALTILLAAGLILAACGGKADEPESSASGTVDESGHITIEFWFALGGDSGKAVEELVKRFNESQAEITVNATYQGDYAALQAKIYSALTGGALPNVAQVGGAPLLGSSGAILPISDFINADPSVDISQIRPVFFDYNTAGGTLWSMPFNNSLPVLYYNKDLFKAAGLDPEDPPQNFDEIIEAGKALTLDPDGTGTPTQYGFNTKDDTHWYISAMILENGGQIVNKEETAVLYNSPEAVEMLELWGTLVTEHKIMPPNQHQEAQTDFLAGKLAMLIGSSSGINTMLESAAFELGVAMFPAVGENERKIPVGGGSLIIFKNDNELLRNASWEFVKFMSSPDAIKYLATHTGYLPFYEDAFEWPEIKQLVADQPTRKAVIDSLEYAVAIPVFPALGNSDLALRQAVEKLELGAEGAQSALDKAKAGVDKSIAEQFGNP